MTLICGIEESGRGPLIGPLIMAGVAIPENKLAKLKKLGVKDSKLLTPKQREQLYPKIIDIVDSHHIVEISAQEIDQRNAVGTNLNKLEAIKAAEIISRLNPDRALIDSPEPSDGGRKFAHMISQHLTLNNLPELDAGHKYDLKFPIVAAASILAKVTRDRRIEEIKKISGQDFGSGYPSDPLCKKFLEEHFEGNISEHIRKCWTTYQAAKEAREQTKLEEF